MRVMFLAFLVCTFASTEIIVIGGYSDVPLQSQNDAQTGPLSPGQEAIFYFTLPRLQEFPLGDHPTLNLWARSMPDDLAFNVRLRKGDDNFDDRDSELKKKTWGVYNDDRLYTCTVDTNVNYYIQVENPVTNNGTSSLSFSLDVDNNDSCQAEDDFGKAIAGIFGGVFLLCLLFCCGVVALVVIVVLCCICACNKSRNPQPVGQVYQGNGVPYQGNGVPYQGNGVSAAAPPHPYYNPVPSAQAQNQQPPQLQGAQGQLPYYAHPPETSRSEAMNNPLIQAQPASERV